MELPIAQELDGFLKRRMIEGCLGQVVNATICLSSNMLFSGRLCRHLKFASRFTRFLTSFFRSREFPQTTAAVLSFMSANPADCNGILPFLDSVLILGIWAVTNDRFAFFDLRLRVLNLHNSLYSPPPLTADEYSRVLSSLVNNHHFYRMLERLQKNTISLRGRCVLKISP
jgi:hypothetical protein